MKALEILKQHYLDSFSELSVIHVAESKMIEAIIELEELQAPKTCRTCLYAGAYTMGWMPCMNESIGYMFKYGVNDNFGCTFYKYMHEPKAQQ